MHQATYTLSEFLTALDAPCVNPKNEHTRSMWIENHRHDWYGIENDVLSPTEKGCAAVRRLISSGWMRGVDLMQQVASSVDLPMPKSIRRRSVWGDHGDEVDMQRVWQGNLDSAWRRMTKTSGLGPQRVRILVDAVASGGLSAETMRWRGVAALRLADALTESGYSVQVESGFEAASPEDYRLRVIVKQYTDPLDLSTLAATTALPGFFRALMHQWQAVVSKRPTGIGYSVNRLQPENFADENDDGSALFVASQSIKSVEAASDWVKECINFLQPAELEAA
jgi:hypothetical protein